MPGSLSITSTSWEGHMPINDMVIELEENVASTEGEGSPTMVSSGKDKIIFQKPQ